MARSKPNKEDLTPNEKGKDPDNRQWEMMGIITFKDPPRSDTREVIKAANGPSSQTPFLRVSICAARTLHNATGQCRVSLSRHLRALKWATSMPGGKRAWILFCLRRCILAGLGVEVKMITGDHAVIAREMARTIGMGTDILDTASLGGMKIETDPETREMIVPKDLGVKYGQMIEQCNGFAQVFKRKPLSSLSPSLQY